MLGLVTELERASKRARTERKHHSNSPREGFFRTSSLARLLELGHEHEHLIEPELGF